MLLVEAGCIFTLILPLIQEFAWCASGISFSEEQRKFSLMFVPLPKLPSSEAALISMRERRQTKEQSATSVMLVTETLSLTQRLR